MRTKGRNTFQRVGGPARTRDFTDNAALPLKVAIRRWLLDRMGITEAYVLDTCSGEGRVWSAMANYVSIAQWVRTDIKPRTPGTMPLSAEQACTALPVEAFNVIDIDPYGDPFGAYNAMLIRRRILGPTAVFLTHGHVAHSVVADAAARAVGMPTDWPMPHSPGLSDFIAKMNLEATWKHATILHAAQIAQKTVDYYAIGLAPL